MRAARLTAVRLAARWKPGDRVLCSGWSPAERVIVDVRPTEDGFVYLACRAPYRGRPISPLYPSQILGPAPVKENP